MSNLKNSPFGKRLRASQADPPDDSEGPRRNKPRTTPSISNNNTPSPRSLPSLANNNGSGSGSGQPLVFSVAPSPDTTGQNGNTPGGASTTSASFTFDTTRQTTVEPESPGPSGSTSISNARPVSPSRGPSAASVLGTGPSGISAMGMGGISGIAGLGGVGGVGGVGVGGAGVGAGSNAFKKDYGDRFVPSRDTGDMRTSYNLMDEPAGPSTPSKTKIIPTESDAVKEQANALFNTILHAEVTPPSPHRPSSPTRPPATTNNSNSSATGPGTTGTPTTPRRRLFAYHSPSAAAASTSGTSPTRRLDTPTDEAYSMSPVRAESRQILESPRRQLRNVCKTPYRVLDAPELADDFYVNVVDWSSTNVLGVGLGSSVYLWTAHTAAVSKLCDLSSGSDTVSSVAWVQRGSTLAVGTISGKLHIYDANTLQLVRSYPAAHGMRIGALAWNQHVLSSGSRDRMIQHRDVREQTLKPFKKSPGHRQEVCGLRWNGEGMGGVPSGMLASGGNDNKVCIWDLRGSRRPGPGGGGGGGAASGSGSMARGGAGSSVGGGGGQGTVSVGAEASVPGAEGGIGDTPLWKFHDHTAAVKALAWDPHVAGVLATGGGTQDKHIRFWNVLYGNKLSELDTGSQVCNLTWSLTSHELVSTHGFSSTTAQNQICIWKYPSLDMVASLTGHTSRVLYLAMSPDGETIVTGAGDETLRFWNAFPKREDRERERRRESRLDWGRLIR